MRPAGRSLAALSISTGLFLPLQSSLAQSWTRLTHDAPLRVGLKLLLSDGTVMAACCDNASNGTSDTWLRLTPDSSGSYAKGTWSTLAPSHYTRVWFSSQVLKDGRVFIAGGEYGTGAARAEIFDPTTDAWTLINPPTSLLDPAAPSPVNTAYTQQFYDSNSAILPDGRVLIAPVLPKVLGQALIYNPTTNLWSAASSLYIRGVYQDEATWTKLPDNTILTLDPAGYWSYQNNPSERFNPLTNIWIDDSLCPNILYDQAGHELGGAVLLPNGKAFFLGATGKTAIYTPDGTTHAGSWAAGAVIPNACAAPDAPCAMMVNGKVLCAVCPISSGTPTTFYEYDYTTNSFALVPAPHGASENNAPYVGTMLTLPNGQVLYSQLGPDVYVYTPEGSPLAAGKPSIHSITQNLDGSFHLTGTGLNGISEGASYGDDAQMASNYPLVRISHSNGNIYYARTYNWSSTGVQTGNAVLSTEYRLPAGLPTGTYSLVVVGNGFASDPASGPGIITNPSSVSACPTGAASLTVSAGGTGPLTYQWHRGTTVLNDGGNITGSRTPTLTFNPPGTTDVGADYYCIVSNLFGSINSAPAGLSICQANCDCSTAAPILTANDFQCFLNKFASGDQAANCDGSTAPPVLTANDFQCYLNLFAASCP